ncbi:uncharacterized protein LOC129976396 [Argiope bruennichi]|uniref:uncharacterized protein LOC129976396 n=1 Tax=Argiope bruennichi TaxID=94029 RepID=UPI002495080B|nr:uncharacterized protein LOC129976396 [Argiope bruennichi]
MRTKHGTITPCIVIMKDNSILDIEFANSIPIVQTFPWTSLLPKWKLPSLSQDLKQPTNPSVISLSVENVYDSGISPKNMKSQYQHPVKYPIYILPCASLSQFGGDSKISCPQNDSKNEIPIYQASISRPHMSDSSSLSVNHGNLTRNYKIHYGSGTSADSFLKNINQAKNDFKLSH